MCYTNAINWIQGVLYNSKQDINFHPIDLSKSDDILQGSLPVVLFHFICTMHFLLYL